mmetsp:Transcript_28763/g.63362  ORF Transcript_28763/g.63362 Transcript_28763/m.63362 type:complete len:123 (+) Transcript_28763:126-494(+)
MHSTRPQSELQSYSSKLTENKHKLVFFYSDTCNLCKTLQPSVVNVQEGNQSWLQVATVCADEQLKWAPEVLHYNVDQVPCFVMLKPNGDALARSGAPRGQQHMTDSLQCLLQLGRHAAAANE